MQDELHSKRVRAWVAVGAWIALILIASGDDFSASQTSRIIMPILNWLFPTMTPATKGFLHFLIRKGAHVTEYGILALLALHTLRLHFSRTRFPAIAIALALVLTTAFIDETHQMQHISRTGTYRDSLLDLSGGVAFLALGECWGYLRRRGSNGWITFNPSELK